MAKIINIIANLVDNKFRQQMKDLESGNYKVNVDVDTGNIDNLNRKLQNTGKTAQSFGTTLKKSMNIGAAATLTAKGMQLIRTAANNATDSIKNYDNAITDLRMATNESYDNVAKMVQGYNAMGKALGATTQEVSSSADAWLRQGMTVKETNALIKDSMMLSKIGQIDSASATQYLTSAMKGYGVEVQNVQTIVDRLCAVDLVSATDAAGLAEAMSRTATTANMAGISMDRLLGYLAVVGETTQKSMSSIGESFKTIFARMSDIKANKLTLVDEDGTAEALSDVEITLKNVGIDLRSTVNEYNDYGEILDSLASKWDSLSQVQQNALAKAFAGQRQQENFRVLMENYDTAKKYMDTAANSAGTAEQKFGAYLDSIEAKTKSLQAAFESLSVNTFSTEMFGDIIDASTALLEFLDTTNLVKGSLAGLAAAGVIKGFTVMATGIKEAAIQMNNFNTALNMIKAGNLTTDEFQKLTMVTQNLSKSQLKAVVSCKTLSTEQRTAILMSSGLSKAEAQAALASMGLANAEGTATAATFSLSGALKGLWATLMSNPLILVIAGVTAAVSAYSSYNQKLEEARQKQLEVGNTARDSANNIKELYDAYNEASTAYANNTGSKEALEGATESLLEALGVEQSQIETLRKEYGSLDDAINQVTADALKSNLNDMTAGYSAAVETLLNKAKEGTFNFDSFDVLKFQNGTDGIKYADALKKAGLISSNDYGYEGGVVTLGDKSTLEGVVAIYNKLIAMRDELGETFTVDELANSDIYKAVNDKINSVKSEYEDVMDYINDINDTAAQLQYLDIIKDTGIPKTVDEFENLRDSMINSAAESGNFVGSQEDIKNSINNTLASIPELKTFYKSSADVVENTADIYSQASSSITQSTSEASDSVKTLVAEINSVQDVLDNQQNGRSISLADFNSAELKDYQSALEYVNGTMQLNAEKVKEIAQAKADEQVAINNTNKALSQAKYLENAKKIERLRQSIKDYSSENWFDKGAEDTINAQIDALLKENSVLADTCKQYDLLSASIQEALGAYQHWLNAQNSSDYGDMANDAVSAIDRIRNTYNPDSEIYGDYGSKKFDAAVDFIVPDSVDKEDLGAVESYMNNFKQYLTFDEKGNTEGLNIDKFLENSVNAGLMSYSEDDGFQVLAGKKMEDFAKGLDMSSGMVQAFFDELQLKGADFDWSDESVKTIGDLAIEANEAAESLKKIDGNSDLKIKMDVSDLKTTDEQVNALDATIAEMDKIKAKPNVDASEINDANAVIQYCLKQKQLLTQPDVMRVDTSQVEGDMGKAIALLQEFQEAQNELEINSKIGADTTEAQSKIDSLTAEIQALSPDIKADLHLNTTSTEAIQKSINNLSAPTLEVDAHVNPEAISGYNPETKSCDVVYEPNTDALPESFSDVSRAVKYYAVTRDLPDTFTTLTRYVRYVKTEDSEVNGTAHISGTAHASGTAKASGDWGTAPGGRTLVGELGREIVVDPRTGRWYTVGDTGAEFRDIPAGAIVFNHLQTEQLLQNGYVSGRASALVNGTAMVTGQYKPYKPNNNSNSASTSSSTFAASTKYKSSNYTATDAQKTVQEVKEAANDFSEVLDSIAIAIERATNEIELHKSIADDLFQTFRNQNPELEKAIAQSEEQIKFMQRAYDRYMAQADADSEGLDDTYKKLIQNGQLDIQSIADENLMNQINSYQESYEKAQDLRNEIISLAGDIRDLNIQKFENIADDFDKIIDYKSELTDMIESLNELNEIKGVSTTVNNLSELMGLKTEIVGYYRGKTNELQEQFNKLVQSGAINEFDDNFWELKTQIEESKNATIEAEKAVYDLKEQIFELQSVKPLEKTIEQLELLRNEYEALSDLINEDALFDDSSINVKLTNAGLAQLGLLSERYKEARQRSVEYTNAITKLKENLKNGNITQGKYNELLAEYSKEQQQAVQDAKDVKDAIIDLRINGIEKSVQAYEKLINIRKEDLQAQKEYKDKEKELNDKENEINAVQRQIDMLIGDEKNVQKIKQLNAEKIKLEDEYNKMVEENRYNAEMDAYEKSLENFQNNADEETKALQTNLTYQNQLISESLGLAKDNYTEIYEYLNMLSDVYGLSIQTNVIDCWKNATEALNTYKDAIGDVMAESDIKSDKIKVPDSKATTTTPSNEQSIKDIVNTSPINDAAQSQNNNNNETNTPAANTDIWNGIPAQPSTKGNSKYNNSKEYSIYDRISWNGYQSGWNSQSQLYQNLNGEAVHGAYRGTSAQNIWMIEQLKARGFKKGGIVGLDQNMINRAGEQGIAIVRNEDVFLNRDDAKIIQNLVDLVPQINDTYDFVSKLQGLNMVSNNRPSVVVQYDNLINIEGHADKMVVDDLKKFSKDIVQQSKEATIKELKNISYKPGFRGLGR